MEPASFSVIHPQERVSVGDEMLSSVLLFIDDLLD
jgi:hypothetical protein